MEAINISDRTSTLLYLSYKCVQFKVRNVDRWVYVLMQWRNLTRLKYFVYILQCLIQKQNLRRLKKHVKHLITQHPWFKR